MPYYVVVIGKNLDLAIKYSLKSLLQVFFHPEFVINLFEVPYMTLNNIKKENMLLDEDFKENKKVDKNMLDTVKVEVKQHQAKYEVLTELFKDGFTQALEDTMKFNLVQSALSSDR